MELPSIPLPSKTVDINGQEITIRSLSRSETIKVTTAFKDNPDGAETFILSRGVGISEDDALKWRDETDPFTAGKLVDAIVYLTGLAEEPNPKD